MVLVKHIWQDSCQDVSWCCSHRKSLPGLEDTLPEWFIPMVVCSSLSSMLILAEGLYSLLCGPLPRAAWLSLQHGSLLPSPPHRASVPRERTRRRPQTFYELVLESTVWILSNSIWWIGMLQSIGSQRVRHTDRLNNSNYLLEASHNNRSILKVRELCFHLLKRRISQNLWMYFKTTMVIIIIFYHGYLIHQELTGQEGSQDGNNAGIKLIQ